MHFDYFCNFTLFLPMGCPSFPLFSNKCYCVIGCRLAARNITAIKLELCITMKKCLHFLKHLAYLLQLRRAVQSQTHSCETSAPRQAPDKLGNKSVTRCHPGDQLKCTVQAHHTSVVHRDIFRQLEQLEKPML